MNLKAYKKVSIIVPILNEEHYIQGCITCLLEQSYPKECIEVFIIDGMSDDRTREIIKNIINQSSFNIKLLDNPKRRIEPALNIGIMNAKGDLIIRIDARSIIPPDYIAKCVMTSQETGADNVGGVQKPIVDKSLISEARNSGFRQKGPNAGSKILTQAVIGIVMSHPFGIGNAYFRLGGRTGYVDTAYLGCFRRDVFDRVGLFDECSHLISEDSDINYRIRKIGGKIYLNKDIIAYYYPRDNLVDFWRLYFSYGLRKAGNLIKYKKLTAWRQFVPLVFLSALFLLPLLGILNKIFFYVWFLIIGSYIFIDFILSLYLAFKYDVSDLRGKAQNGDVEKPGIVWKIKLSLFWRLFFSFPIMHFSWVFGFWKRLLQNQR